jgi:thymidylate synthase ThyX
MFKARVICDSAWADSRLTTMELTYPRIVHSEFMTHRRFSRNAASSRAIPIRKMIRDVEETPFVPIHWGAAQRGMQAYQEISPEKQEDAKQGWLIARDDAVKAAWMLNDFGLHKQIVNRLLEPFQWMTVVCSGCEPAWANFFDLRCHEAAEPHMQLLANMARREYEAGTPTELGLHDWHLPYIQHQDMEMMSNMQLAKVSAARCARVSYLTHDGRRDVSEDLALYERLVGQNPKHASALEHTARAMDYGELTYPNQMSNFD